MAHIERLLITLFGPAGSGKGTVGARFASILECAHIDIGDLCRNQAELYGITLEERHIRAKEDPTLDAMLDNRVRELPLEYPRLVISSRTAWFLLPESIKILLTCRPEVGAERVAKRQNISFEEALQRNTERDAIDAFRYKKYLGIQKYPPTSDQFDVVVDSSDVTPDQVVEQMVTLTKARL